MRVLSGLLLTLVAAGLLRLGTALPAPFRSPGGALLRLSWTARPERLEHCRVLTAEELARELEHMRQRVECEGRFASYALRVRIDGRPTASREVRGGGFRHDRPLHLLTDLPIPAGPHRLEIEFLRHDSATTTLRDSAGTRAPTAGADTGIFAGRAEREGDERERRRRAAIPPRLVLDTSLVFAAEQVVLISFDPERRRLVLRTGPAQ
jgi:hypothetical protein